MGPTLKKMKAELIDVSQCKKNLDIEIPQEVVDAEIARGRTPCGPICTLLDIAQLELWLRGLHNRGVLQFQGA